MRALLITVLLTTALQRPASVGAELLARNLPAPLDAADLEQPITSYAVLDDAKGFVIAYYVVQPDGMLRELRIRSFDRATGAWRKLTRAEPIGSVVSVHRSGGYLYVTGHTSPSAAPLLALTDSLQLKRELDGWPKLTLDDGRVVFGRSMIHFAPTHAAALALYDPAADREIAIYPAASAGNERGQEQMAGTDLWMERTIGEVSMGPRPGIIEFTAREQRMRVDSRRIAQPAAPERRLAISCDIAVTPPVCRATGG